MAARLSPVGALARAADYDRYLSALFAPAARREALFALIAFNHEIARIPEAVSEPMLGRIRLQWWRETLEAIHDGKPARRHEVALPLADAIHAWGLDRGAFERLLDGREADLEPDAPPDLAGLERYAAATGGALTALMLQACGVGRRVGAGGRARDRHRLGADRHAPRRPPPRRAGPGHAARRPPRRGRDQHRGYPGGPGVRPLRRCRRAGGGARRRTACRGAPVPPSRAPAVPRGAVDRPPRGSLPRPAARRRVGPARFERLAVGPLRKQGAMLAGAATGRY